MPLEKWAGLQQLDPSRNTKWELKESEGRAEIQIQRYGVSIKHHGTELMWAGEAAMRKSISTLRQARCESISDLPRIQENYRENALVAQWYHRNEDMCNVERRAKSSSVNFGSARTVTETSTAYTTVLWTSGLARTQAAVGREEITR